MKSWTLVINFYHNLVLQITYMLFLSQLKDKHFWFWREAFWLNLSLHLLPRNSPVNIFNLLNIFNLYKKIILNSINCSSVFQVLLSITLNDHKKSSYILTAITFILNNSFIWFMEMISNVFQGKIDIKLLYSCN